MRYLHIVSKVLVTGSRMDTFSTEFSEVYPTSNMELNNVIREWLKTDEGKGYILSAFDDPSVPYFAVGGFYSSIDQRFHVLVGIEDGVEVDPAFLRNLLDFANINTVGPDTWMESYTYAIGLASDDPRAIQLGIEGVEAVPIVEDVYYETQVDLTQI